MASILILRCNAENLNYKRNVNYSIKNKTLTIHLSPCCICILFLYISCHHHYFKHPCSFLNFRYKLQSASGVSNAVCTERYCSVCMDQSCQRAAFFRHKRVTHGEYKRIALWDHPVRVEGPLVKQKHLREKASEWNSMATSISNEIVLIATHFESRFQPKRECELVRWGRSLVAII